MAQTAPIKSLPVALAMMKAMQAEGVEWGEDYRGAARHGLAELREGRMDQLIDEHLERMAELGQADRRNGCYRRWRLTERGAIELAVPRTRTFSALRVVQAYARRAKDVDRMILACFVLGLSPRKVAIAQFLGDLVRRGLHGQCLEMLCVDGAAGLLAALPTACPEVPVQRCWAGLLNNRRPGRVAVRLRRRRRQRPARFRSC